MTVFIASLQGNLFLSKNSNSASYIDWQIFLSSSIDGSGIPVLAYAVGVTEGCVAFEVGAIELKDCLCSVPVFVIA